MPFLEILDYLLQFLGREVLEAWINRVSLFFTKILVRFPLPWIKLARNNRQFPKLVLLHRSENFLVIDKPPDLLINSNDYRKVSMGRLIKVIRALWMYCYYPNSKTLRTFGDYFSIQEMQSSAKLFTFDSFRRFPFKRF